MADDRDVILLCEDDETLRMGLADKLAMEGYRILETGTGEEALAAIAEEDPSLAILDVGLPGMTGLEVLSRLRERPNRFPVILLTARAGEGDKVLLPPSALQRLMQLIPQQWMPAPLLFATASAAHTSA